MRKLIIGVSRKIEYQLRKKIYNKLLLLDYDFFQKNETGDIVSRSTNDLNDVRVLLGPGIMYIPNAISRLLIFIPVLIGLCGFMMLIIGILLTLLMLLIVLLLPRLQPLFRRIQEYMGKINNRVWQTITGISTIKQYAIENIEIKRFKELNKKYINAHMSVIKLREFLWPFFILFFSITELIILLVGGKLVIHGEMTMGQLLQFSMLIAFLTFPVLSLGWVMSLLQQGISAMGRINYILENPVEVKKSARLIETDDITYVVKNLNFRFPGDSKYTLQKINISFKSGQTIGITGTIGSGKSTLLNILSGLLMPEPGMVYVNGMDIRQLDLEQLNKKISVVSQSPFLFSKTIAENISLGLPNLNMDLVREASKNAGLKNEINNFSNGFDQMVGERGITLSGGQKQRVAIARALYKSAPVLILDDPLSNIDAETESEILKNLKLIGCYHLLILVSHRISALKHSDIIYVMHRGEIVELGTHLGLMRKNGIYANLARLQQMEI